MRFNRARRRVQNVNHVVTTTEDEVISCNHWRGDTGTAGLAPQEFVVCSALQAQSRAIETADHEFMGAGSSQNTLGNKRRWRGTKLMCADSHAPPCHLPPKLSFAPS